MIFFKKTYYGTILKSFQILNKSDSIISKNHIDLTIKFMQEFSLSKFKNINLNMRHNDFTINRLYEHLEKAKEQIDSIEIFFQNEIEYSEATIINYKKTVINSEKYVFEIMLRIGKYLLNDENTVKYIITEYSKIMSIDYGFIYHIPSKTFDEYTESESSATTQKDYEKRDKLINVTNGYIPKIYKYNILNKSQINTLNTQNVEKTTDNLFLFIGNTDSFIHFQ